MREGVAATEEQTAATEEQTAATEEQTANAIAAAAGAGGKWQPGYGGRGELGGRPSSDGAVEGRRVAVPAPPPLPPMLRSSAPIAAPAGTYCVPSIGQPRTPRPYHSCPESGTGKPMDKRCW